MGSRIRAGDDVTWDTSQGRTRGTVVKKVTSATRVKGHVAKASKADPQYLVRSRQTGAKAVHKPSELKPTRQR